MKLGVRTGFPPFLFAALRQTTAGLLLTGYLIFIVKLPLPGLSHLWRNAISGLLMITFGNGLVSWAVVYVPSSVAAIICSAMPVCIVLLNLTFNRAEFPNILIIIGVLAGMGGILMVFGEHLADFSDPKYSLGIILIFVATISWAFASFLMKKSNRDVSPFLNAGLQMFFGGLFCLPFSLAFDDYTGLAMSATTAYALLYVMLVGSIAAYTMYSYALTYLPLTIASLYSYINPLVAVVLGSLVLSEKLNFKIAVAILITIAGIYLVNLGYQQLVKEKT